MKNILAAAALGTTSVLSVSCQPNGDATSGHQAQSSTATTQKVKIIIQEILGTPPSQIRTSDSFIADLGADSLDHVELIMATEEEFDIAISDSDAAKLVTVGDLISYLETSKP